MTGWTEGYVSDIPYALGFYRETTPSHIAFAAACVGKHPGRALQPKRVLELGFGMGLGFIINAAANPGIEFEGVDFNPVHVAHAQGLADEADLTNVSMREASFQDLAREACDGQQDLDLIVLHGILTWVSAEAHDAIVEIARKRLRPGGYIYVSYNCMPGWAPVIPLQRLMRESAKRNFAESSQQTRTGLELVKALATEGSTYFRVNPTIEQRFDKLLAMDPNYLAHEYLNANWFIFHFADIADMFARAKLGFIGSATLAENMDDVSVPENLRQRVGTEADPIFKETLRDIAGNKQFRRDLFARGSTNLTAAESVDLLGRFRFFLALPKNALVFKYQVALGEISGKSEIYNMVADRLDRGDASFDEVASLPVFDGNRSTALQTLALMIHGGQVLPAVAGSIVDLRPAQRLNRVLSEKMKQGRTYQFLAAPNAGSGIQVAQGDLLMFAAVVTGQGDDVDALADHVEAVMVKLGVNWQRDGKAILDPAERRSFAEAEAKNFLSNKLPLWRHLGIL